MKRDIGFEDLRKNLAEALGLSSVADVPYDIYHDAGNTVVRLPGPGETGLDRKEEDVTHDVSGSGKDEIEAFENACKKYWEAVEQAEMEARKGPKKVVGRRLSDQNLATKTDYVYH